MLPVRGLASGKVRLGGALDAEERETLILGMLMAELRTLIDWGACERIHVVSPDARVLQVAAEVGANPIPEPARPGTELNGAVIRARDAAMEQGATALLVLPADLPLLNRASLDRLLDAADAALAAGGGGPIAVLTPSDARGGTNALLLSPPDIITPQFGAQSLEQHARRAAEVAATLQFVVDGDLGFDLDTPEDLVRLDTTRLTQLLEVDGRRPERPTTPQPPGEPGRSLRRVTATALPALPEVRPGDDLAALIADAWRSGTATDPELAPMPGDVLVVTQKVVSKAESQVVDLGSIEPRREAVAFAQRWDRDPRQVEVVLRESARVLRMERGVIISRTRHGFVCANAGVDASNVTDADTVTLLPVDPDASAQALRERLGSLMAAELRGAAPPAVLVSDSFGRPWRWGITDVALGAAGLQPLDDQRGRPDASGRVMRSTVVAIADEICAAAELASGKTSRRPVVLVRGVELPQGETTVRESTVMDEESDLFP